MIIRLSEASVRPGRFEAFRQAVVEEVRGYPQTRAGFVGHELLVDEQALSLIYVSRWRDEQAVEAFAGPGWEDTPVTFAGEGDYLTAPLRVRHYRRSELD